MRVFISHSSKDKPHVLALAEALRARAIVPWVDKWEIGPRDDIVGRINQGLHEADAGIIVFSANSADSNWIKAEVNYLTWARIEDQKPLIPVILGDNPVIPPLLRPPLLLRRRTQPRLPPPPPLISWSTCPSARSRRMRCVEPWSAFDGESGGYERGGRCVRVRS